MATATKEKARKKVPDRIEKYTESLKVRLTVDELAERSDRMSNLIASAQEKEADMKAAAAHAKSVIAEITSEIHRLANEVRTRSTYRPIECRRQWQYEQGQMREIRMDTFEIIGGRKLTERELQPEFPFDESNCKEPADESWRAVPIGDALKGLPKNVYKAFEQCSIATMGAFADFQQAKGDFWIQDLPGVGPESASKIADAAEVFWKDRLATASTSLGVGEAGSSDDDRQDHDQHESGKSGKPI